MGRGCEVCSFDLCAVPSHTWLLHSWPAVTNVCVLIFVCIAGATKIETKNWTCVNDSFAPYGGAKVFSGAGTVFFSYLGFDMVSSMAEEVTKPQRDLPLGIIGSLVIAGALRRHRLEGVVAGVLGATEQIAVVLCLCVSPVLCRRLHLHGCDAGGVRHGVLHRD